MLYFKDHTWLKILLYPDEKNFLNVLATSPTSKKRSLDQLLIGSIGFALAILNFVKFSYTLSSLPEYEPTSKLDHFWNFVRQVPAMCGYTFAFSLFLLFIVVLAISLVQVISTIQGGIGTREKMLYSYATYLKPLGILAGILSFIPIIKYFVFVVCVYIFILAIIATKAVNGFSWKKAVLSNLIVLWAFMLFLISVMYIFYVNGIDSKFLPV